MTTPSFIPKLPVEVCERIIDNASIDTVKLCGQVCHSWVPRSRVHIFESVNLNSRSRASKFLFLLEHSPTLACYVCILRIHASHSASSWLDRVLGTLPSLLPNVHTLSLSQIPHFEPAFFASVSRFTNVKSLELARLDTRSFHEIIQIVNLYENLQDLNIQYCATDSFKVHPDDNIRSHKLKTFKHVGFPAHQMVVFSQWIVESNSCQGLSTLDLMVYKISNELKHLLQLCSKTLQSLRLDFVVSYTRLRGKCSRLLQFLLWLTGRSTALPVLADFGALRVLSLKFNVGSDDLPLLLQKLAHGVPKSLEFLQLTYTTNITNLFHKTRQARWLALDRFLSSPDLSKPLSLEIQSDPSSDQEPTEEFREGVLQKRRDNVFRKELVLLNRHGIFSSFLPIMYERGLLWCVDGWGSKAYQVSPIEPERWLTRESGCHPSYN